ncbi:uncharacterized protein LOC143282547 [Babylonia areolata]|uniref:uncharacterized protein LOC143282547 n=1 Tax=Babylonia areolata TaxID=304850 RepID=UPI003FD48096
MSAEESQTNTSNSSNVFFSRSRQNKVRPISAGTAESVQVEVRPRRFLRIQHINARPRDAKFEKEMQVQMQYKKQGITATGGPLSMPKKKPVREASALNGSIQGSAALPNSINPSGGDDSGYRQVSASGSKTPFTSPSNVHVAVESSGNRITSGPSQAASNEAIGKENHAETQNTTSDANERKQEENQAQNQNIKSDTEKQNQMENIDEEPNRSAVDTGEKRPNSDHNTPASSTSQSISQTTTPRHQRELKAVPNNSLTPRTPSTVLFFFHGVGGSSDVWQAQIRYFAKEGYEIIAPDMIGHGMSCTPRDAKSYHFLETAADMEEIFDKYCKKRNIVIGHSYGCSFAVVLARRRSRRVHKLVLISGGAPTPLAPQPGIFTLPRCMLGCVRPCLNHGFHRSAFHKAVVDKEEAFSIPTYVLQHTMNGQVWPDGDELYHQWLLCSTLLVYGARDKLVTLKEEKHMEEVIFRSRLEVITDASHMVMIEAPDEVNRLLLNFFLEDSSLGTKNSSPQPPANPPPPLDRSVSRMSLKSTKSYKAMPSHVS